MIAKLTLQHEVKSGLEISQNKICGGDVIAVNFS